MSFVQSSINRFFPALQQSAAHQIYIPMAWALVGVALLTVSAKVQVPAYPVPMTLQTMVVLMIGLSFGARLAFATVMAYLALGALGYPVFAGTPEKGLGLVYMSGTTGGYLLGFLLSATLMGWLADRLHYGQTFKSALLAILLGVITLYSCGVIGLGLVIGFDKPLFALGVLPFLPGEAIKAVVAMVTLPTAWKLMRR